jgi:hypothetical protein
LVTIVESRKDFCLSPSVIHVVLLNHTR